MPQDPGQNSTILNSSRPAPAFAHDRPNDHVINVSESDKGQESGNVTDFETFVEAATEGQQPNFIDKNGNALVKIIKPGWGSSGYYKEAALERDGPKVYAYGTHMHMDHPTAIDEKARPERSLTTLASVITNPGKYLKNGPKGEGVYAEVHVFKPYREALNEMAPFIGLSHRAIGQGKTGTIEGRTGKIIESLQKCLSVDWVTLPGAGGSVVQMIEAWRIEHEPPADHETIIENQEEIMGNDKETVITVESLRKTNPGLFTELKESVLQEIQASEAHKQKEADAAKVLKENQDMKVELDRLREAQVIQESGKIVIKALEKSTLPEITKTRLIETVPRLARMKDGKLDEAAFTAAVTEAIKTETDYVAKLTESGKVKGMGGGNGGSGNGGASKLKESFIKAFRGQGKSQKDAEMMAEIAVNGR
ncbi:MAG: hypothetical protein M0Q92_02750 [Methanoregula sp.]|jgi:hypothetical protein|nr:hypothetical protein [Methanoregula sp.]